MVEQIYWENVTEGQELPSIKKIPTTKQLVKFAGASGEFSQIHYDKDFAQKSGLPGVIVHGWLTFSIVGQVITNWMGLKGKLKKIGMSYRGMLFPGEEITCRASVTKKYTQDHEHLIDLEIWAENPKGEKKTMGNAVVALPAKV